VTATNPEIPKRHNLEKHASSIAARLSDGDPEDLFTPKQVAEIIQYSTQWLAQARSNGYGPPFVRISATMVRYRRRDLLAWLRSLTETPKYGKPRRIWNKGIPGRPGWPPKSKKTPKKTKAALQAAE
jgi:hypothetical protein